MHVPCVLVILVVVSISLVTPAQKLSRDVVHLRIGEIQVL